VTALTAQEQAESLAERLRKTGRHDVAVTERESDFGRFWFVCAHGKTVADRSLIAIGWFQNRPGRPGPQVRFYGGLADGYGDQAGKLINLKTRAQLEMWMHVCIESKGPIT